MRNHSRFWKLEIFHSQTPAWMTTRVQTLKKKRRKSTTLPNFLVLPFGFFLLQRGQTPVCGKRHNTDVCWCIQDVASHKFFGVSFDKPRWWSLRGFFVYFCNVLSRRRMQCFHTHSLNPRKLIQIKTRTHTRHTLAAILNATHLKTRLAQIIKINTLEAWHYAKETSHFWKKSYKKLLNNLSLLHVFVILTITYILYADEGYTSVVNLWMT